MSKRKNVTSCSTGTSVTLQEGWGESDGGSYDEAYTYGCGCTCDPEESAECARINAESYRGSHAEAHTARRPGADEASERHRVIGVEEYSPHPSSSLEDNAALRSLRRLKDNLRTFQRSNLSEEDYLRSVSNIFLGFATDSRLSRHARRAITQAAFAVYNPLAGRGEPK